MSTLLFNAYVVTRHDTGAEYGGGWILVEDGFLFSGPHRVDRLYVGGEEILRDGRLVPADEGEIAKEHRVQAERFAA